MPSTPTDLAEHRLIAFRNRRPRQLKGPEGEAGHFDPAAGTSQLIIDDGQSQIRATLAGVGISLNALWSVHKELVSGRLVRVLPDYEAAEDDALWLIYPKSNVLSPKVRMFMDFLIDAVGKTRPWEAPVDHFDAKELPGKPGL